MGSRQDLYLPLELNTCAKGGVQVRRDDLHVKGLPQQTNNVDDIIVCAKHHVVVIDLDTSVQADREKCEWMLDMMCHLK